MSVSYVIIGFLLMLGLMFLGIPIAASMAVIGILGGLMAYGMPFINSIAPVVWGVHNDNLLTSIPLFILMGELLLRSGIADRMFGALAAWLGRLPGGLLHTNIGCSAIFAATSGSSVATAATIGTVALPSLHKRGYSMPMSLGSIAAGGTLGILIPPSVNMIVYGSITETSIGRLFVAGIIPGVLLSALFMGYIMIHSIMSSGGIREEKVPLEIRLRLLKDLIPPGVVFVVVMGSLYSGVATTTESAALGVVASMAFAWHSKRLTWQLMEHCFIQTAKTTGMMSLPLNDVVLGSG
ncbi:MAG: TRAP transporter large permease [Burkholderiaceae bacterium]